MTILRLPVSTSAAGAATDVYATPAFVNRQINQVVDEINAQPAATPAITVGIVPYAGGGQASATQLNNGYNYLAAGYQNGDSIQLPSAVAGSIVTIFSDAGTLAALFAKNGTGDTINGRPNATQYDITFPSTPTICVCTIDGAWWANVSQD